MKNLKILIILILLLTLGIPQQQVFALDFSPNDIISNGDLLEYDSMSLAAIHELLNNHNGILKNYSVKDYFGTQRSAAEIIYNASQLYRISPKWVLATLQKEQSLITNPSPSQYNLDWAMGYAVCDSCTVDDPRVQRFKGFGTQVDRATWRIKYYFENPHEFNFRVGQLYNIDGLDVLIYNQATANLYNYTPHIHGNKNFWIIWNRWFSKIYPDGTLVRQEGQSGVWLIEYGKRRPFWSKTALASCYDTSNIIEVSRNDLLRYDIGYPIKYPNYSLLSGGDGKVYLTVNNEKKHIESAEVFRLIGYNSEEVVAVTDDELDYYKDGRKITLTSLYPQGALLQDSKSGGVYYVEDGIKYPIWDKEIMLANYPNYRLTQVSTDELSKYVTAATGVGFKDGTLMKTVKDPKVYVISNGKRRWVANEGTFNQLGYKWNNIIDVSEKVASLHPVGQELDLLFSSSNNMAIK